MKVTGVAIRFVGEFKHLKRQRGYWVSVFNTMQNIWAGVVQVRLVDGRDLKRGARDTRSIHLTHAQYMGR